MEQSSVSLKVVVVGDSSVGKTCISLRFLTGEFPTQTRPTIAAGFCNCVVNLNKQSYDLLVWDTAGQEAFRSLTSQYYRDAKIAFIVFDLTNSSTFASIRDWYTRVTDASKTPVTVFLVGNKADLANREVTLEDATNTAKDIGAHYRETSALSGKGITELFEDSVEEYLRANPAVTSNIKSVQVDQGNVGKKGCCG